MTSETDIHYMRMALNLARRGLGRVAPNPAVGCVLIKDGAVLATGWTGDGGRPHAERVALDKAGAAAKGAVAYVTLEPCAHHGQTPPCAQGLIDAEVSRVVVACSDPDPRVSGRGISMLEEAGIAVQAGVLEEEAQGLNAGFFKRITAHRPFVTLKCAVSADGKIAAAKGVRTQISGAQAARYVHLVRSFHDAILVGKGTYETDQPRLTTRIKGYTHDALKVVIDRPVKEMLAQLAEQGVTRLLVEGGAKVHQSFLEAGLYDEVQLLKSSKILGEEGVDAADFGGAADLSLQETRGLGEDLLEIYRRGA